VRRLLRAIVYNWPLKLAAIALATLLYAGLVVSRTTYEFPTAIPITPLHQPTTAVLLGNLPPVTRIRYVSAGDPGAGPTPSSFRATIDLATVDPAAGEKYVAVNVESVDPRFLVVDYEPRGVNVQLDPFTTGAMFDALIVAGTLHENAAHRERRGGEEMSAAVPLLVAGHAKVSFEKMFHAVGLLTKPSPCGVIVVGAGIENRNRDGIVRQVFDCSLERELEHFHSRQTRIYYQSADRIGNDAEVFGYEFSVREAFPNNLKQLPAGPRFPLVNSGICCLRRDIAILIKPAEVINSNHVVEGESGLES